MAISGTVSSLLLPETKKHAMKKLFTILLAAGMFSIYSCGSGGEKTEGTTDSAAVAPAPAPAAAPADSAAATPADTGAH